MGERKKMVKEQGIHHLPIALFASVMGIASLTIAYRLWEGLFSWTHYVSNGLLIFVTILFLFQASIVLYRVKVDRQTMKQELHHHVQMNFYGTISISLFLLAVLYVNFSDTLSFVLWLIGALLQIALTLYLLAAFFWERQYELTQFNPTWFIPIVGNIVAPLSGVYHVDPLFNWMFFGIGIVFTIIYYVIFVLRILFYPPLPVMLMPTYFIILAPLAIGVTSYIKLTGNVDVFAYILYGIATYIVLLFLTQLKRFFTIPFFISWWAYLFPCAAYTNATIYMYTVTNTHYLLYWAIGSTLVTTVLMIYLLNKTSTIARKGMLTIKNR